MGIKFGFGSTHRRIQQQANQHRDRVNTQERQQYGGKYVDQATQAAQQNYGGRQPFRDYGMTALNAAGIPTLDGPYNPDDLYSQFQPITTQYGGDGGLSRAALDKVLHGPDRIAMARGALADLDTAAAPQRALDFKQVGQKAATLGRIGSGQVTTDLGNIESDYQRNRLLTENDLIRNATEADVGDRFQALDAATRADEIGYGRAANMADELRGERGYRRGLGQEGLQNRTDLQQRRFNQAMGASQFGYSNDPSDALFRQGQFAWQQHTGQQARDDARKQQARDNIGDMLSVGAQFIPYGGQAYNTYRSRGRRDPYAQNGEFI